MTFCLHELSLNQNIQEKARQNVCEVLAKHDGKINYDSLNEMKYLEQCINESLSKFTAPSKTYALINFHIYSREVSTGCEFNKKCDKDLSSA